MSVIMTKMKVRKGTRRQENEKGEGHKEKEKEIGKQERWKQKEGL